jgi:dephospho-CoA kinase
LVAVVRRFGAQVLGADGLLDRRRLRALVFTAPEERRALESILHPLIRADMEALEKLATGPYVVMAIPLLVEGGDYDRIDRILVVDVPQEIQLARLQARDGSSTDQALAIIAAQASRERRLQAADDVLINAGTLDDLWRRVDDLHQTYLSLADTKT